MGRHAFLAAALLLAAGVPGTPSAATSGLSLDELQEYLERVQSMRATFRQETINGQQEVVEESRGRVVLKRPGRFRWDYEQPYQRVVVADGERLWLYEADLQQVTVRPLAAGLGETPAALLTGGRAVVDRFEYVSSWSGDTIRWISLRPRSPDSDFDSVAVGFAGGQLVQIAIDNRLGQQTRVHLSDIELNARVADDTFRFKVPDGVDVIREGEL